MISQRENHIPAIILDKETRCHPTRIELFNLDDSFGQIAQRVLALSLSICLPTLLTVTLYGKPQSEMVNIIDSASITILIKAINSHGY